MNKPIVGMVKCAELHKTHEDKTITEGILSLVKSARWFKICAMTGKIQGIRNSVLARR